LMQRALNEKGFADELRELATFQPVSFKMRVIVAFANALFEISEGKGEAAWSRMQVLKILYKKMT